MAGIVGYDVYRFVVEVGGLLLLPGILQELIGGSSDPSAQLNLPLQILDIVTQAP